MTNKKEVIETRNEQHLPLLEHLREFKKRFIYCLIFFLIAFGICYAYSKNIYNILLQPLAESMKIEGGTNRIIYTNLTEGFMTYIKTGVFGAMFISIPFFFLQLYIFIAPGLYKREKKLVIPLVFFSILLFLCGVLLAYFLVIPMAWNFFLSFQSIQAHAGLSIELETRMSDYFNLTMKMINAFGLIFELPILIILLVKFEIITIAQLKHSRKYVFVASFLIGALLTPPDVMSQIILAIPLYLLYEISIIISKFLSNNK